MSDINKKYSEKDNGGRNSKREEDPPHYTWNNCTEKDCFVRIETEQGDRKDVFIVPRKDSNICGKVTKEVDIKNKWCLAYSKEFLEKGSCVNQRDITDDGEFTLPED